MIAKALDRFAYGLKIIGDAAYLKWGKGDYRLRKREVRVLICQHIDAFRLVSPQGEWLFDMEHDEPWEAKEKFEESIERAVFVEDYETAEVIRDLSREIIGDEA